MGTLITLDKRFEKSVNLYFDIGRRDKIDSYIETDMSKDIIRRYLQSLRSDNRERVSMLAGPYGKGKSHLLLVLADKLEHMDKPYLPVIISYGQQDLKREFILGLQRALNRAGILDIQPDSYYREAVRHILMWKKEYRDTYFAFLKLLEQEKISADRFIDDLGRYSEKSLTIFKKLYPLLTSGGVFEPLITTDLKENFVSINSRLSKKYGYRGIFVIFDEFDKYIEGHNLNGFENDMKVLQDMCELAVKSDEPQFHLTMVTHKSIKEYGNTVDKRILNGFMGIEGRIKELFFVDSVRSHYELIASVIQKDEKLFQTEIAENKDTGYKKVVSESFQHPYFQTLFTYEEFERVLGRGCYPLTPVAAYLLLHISFKMAQNERTLFTFLAGSDIHGLGSLLKANGEKSYFGGEVVYDYFENIFREEVANRDVHSQWLKADYAINSSSNEDEKKFIKNLALFDILHRENEMPATDLNIALSMGISRKKCEEIRNNLIRANLITFREKRRICRLKNSIGVDLEEEIKRIGNEILTGQDMLSVLEQVSQLQYELPKRYNSCYQMTRFFGYQFLHGKEFTALKTFRYLFEEKFSDGKIILLLEHVEEKDMMNTLRDIDDVRVVVINPKKDFHAEELLQKYRAIEILKEDEDFIHNNRVALTELELCRQEIFFDINELINTTYVPENGKCRVYSLAGAGEVKNTQDFNRLLSIICESYYMDAPKVNHELINRNHISSQIRKSRRILLDKILGTQDMSGYLKGTSAEATIYRAAMVRTKEDAGTQEMCRTIKEFVNSAAGVRQGFNTLYNRLQGRNYGIRKGIIPLYLAETLSGLTDLPVIYCIDKEVKVSPEILENIEKCPEDYSLYLEKATVEKEAYLLSLKELFGGDSESDILNSIVDGMLNWYRSLPQYSCTYRTGLSGEQIRFRQMLKGQDKNADELLFKSFPENFGTKDFPTLFHHIQSVKKVLDTHMDNVYREAGDMVRRVFQGTKKDDLHNLIKKWCRDNGSYIESQVCSQEVKKLYDFAEGIKGYEDKAVFSDLSKHLMGVFPENWSETSLNHLEKLLTSAVNEVAGNKEEKEGFGKVRFVASDGRIIEKSYDILEEDGTGTFLENAIEDALQEFDGVMDNKQKVAVLVRTLERVIKNG